MRRSRPSFWRRIVLPSTSTTSRPTGGGLRIVSTESGRFEVYVQPFRRPGQVVRVPTAGGGQPRWRGDGKELFYLAPDGTLMTVSIGDGPDGAAAGVPTTLLPLDRSRAVIEGPDYDDYDVTADGQRFLLKAPGDKSERPQIHVLVEWPAVLK